MLICQPFILIQCQHAVEIINIRQVHNQQIFDELEFSMTSSSYFKYMVRCIGLPLQFAMA
ncbi:hypothetical protein METHB2_110064 [Candidatus Methylobacter favarea]|uniref:Uncharacterized protein n=1 Tax=Candidatus Methylobacter favarea TaxID=2707345 RepID=A0A8S0X6W0_9GAMM|nr:hypothetical protein METHB2_110064 [Candidatus Methylobacter favarea]